MSVTIAHKPHVQAPWLQIVVVLVIAAAALIVALTALEQDTTPASTSVRAVGAADESAVVAAGSAVTAKNKSPVVRAVMSSDAPATRPPQSPASSLKSARAPWSAGGAR